MHQQRVQEGAARGLRGHGGLHFRQEWAEKKGVIAHEFTVKVPGAFPAKNDHLPGFIDRKRRAMARLIITRCFQSCDINACGSGSTPLTAAVDKHDGLGCTALPLASGDGHVRCMRILLDVGKADVYVDGC